MSHQYHRERAIFYQKQQRARVLSNHMQHKVPQRIKNEYCSSITKHHHREPGCIKSIASQSQTYVRKFGKRVSQQQRQSCITSDAAQSTTEHQKYHKYNRRVLKQYHKVSQQQRVVLYQKYHSRAAESQT